MSGFTTLRAYLDNRKASGTLQPNVNSLGVTDKGRYFVPEHEYEEFLKLVHKHVFVDNGVTGLIEAHKEVAPLLIDLDFRYLTPKHALVRRFGEAHLASLVRAYATAITYFFDVSTLPSDLRFFVQLKPAPEVYEKHGAVVGHKDGVHIVCPDLVTTPAAQFALRGFLLQRDMVDTVFRETGFDNAVTDVLDKSIIKANGWMMYGACKPNRAYYRVRDVWVLPREVAVAEGALFEQVEQTVRMYLEETLPPTDTWQLMKTLSIRWKREAATPCAVRPERADEWAALLAEYDETSKPARAAAPVRAPAREGGAAASASASASASAVPPSTSASASPSGGSPRVDDPEGNNALDVRSPVSAEEVQMAYRIVRECLDPVKRAGDYKAWTDLGLCLLNIARTEEAFAAWVDISKRVPNYASVTEEECRTKWEELVRGCAARKLQFGSLVHWAREDNTAQYENILKDTHMPWVLANARETHVHVATLVTRMYRHEFRCSPRPRGPPDWFHFPTGEHAWRPLRSPTELRARLSNAVRNVYIEAERVVMKREAEARGEEDKAMWAAKRKPLQALQKHLEMVKFKDDTLKECGEKFHDEDFACRLNTNPGLVGVKNGVLELRHYAEGAASPIVLFRDGKPDDCVSFQMGKTEPDMDALVYKDYDAADPLQRELAEFFCKIYPDAALREYMITLLAACLEGQNKEQRFYIMTGNGSNGKSMLTTLLRFTFGDYQTSLASTVLTRKRADAGAANPDLITVKGKRFMYMVEPDEGERINTALMKQLSGEDVLQARALFGDAEKFKVMGRIFMACNDMPPVSSTDGGTWRRLRVIPHVAKFVDPDQAEDPARFIWHKDYCLEDKLRKWRGAFLSLLKHYYETRYLPNGLHEPEVVCEASNKYKAENDSFLAFCGDCLVVDPAAPPTPFDRVFMRYKDWLRSGDGRAGQKRLTKKDLEDRLQSVAGPGSTKSMILGLRVKQEGDAEGAEGASDEGSDFPARST